TTLGATWGSAGASQRKSIVAAAAPTSCAIVKPVASSGRMPAKVLVAARATVTAGLANDVEAGNQYALVTEAASAERAGRGRGGGRAQMGCSRPKGAPTSP